MAIVLLDLAPQTAKIQDGTGRLPIHLAAVLDDQYDSALLSNLMHLYPESLGIPCPVTKLYPFQLAASASSQSAINKVFLLLRQALHVLSLGTRREEDRSTIDSVYRQMCLLDLGVAAGSLGLPGGTSRRWIEYSKTNKCALAEELKHKGAEMSPVSQPRKFVRAVCRVYVPIF
jgi:hypothetical protein